MVAHMATHIEISGRPTCPDSMHFLYHFFLFLFFSPTIQSIQKYFLLYNLTITTLEQNHHLLSLNCHDSLLICLPTIISVSLLFICHMEARLFFIWIIFFPSKNHLLASSHTPNSAKASNSLHDLWSSLSPTLCLFNGLCALCLVAQSCPTLCDPLNLDHQAPLSMGILQARILERVVMPSSRGSFQPKDQTQVFHIAGRFFTIWATKEAQEYWSG